MDYYQFIFTQLSPGKKDILIAYLDNMGFEGFEEEDNELKAFIGVDQFDDLLFDKIIEQNNLKFSKSIIKEINWNEKWESAFEPVIIPDLNTGLPSISIRADFHKPVNDISYDIIITPKMSFGTGHHATTWLMAQQMLLLDFNGKKIIDFGTGTGILAILAEKLGAVSVIAIDNDDWSINNTLENIVTNECKQVSVIKAETIRAGLKADIILANINLNIIISNINAIKAACNPGAHILFSGIMSHDMDEIKMVLSNESFLIVHSFTKDNWLVILALIP